MTAPGPPLIAVLAAITLISTARAQPGSNHYRAAFQGPYSAVKPGISGAPYSARQIHEFEAKLPDGTRGICVWTEWLYRDSQGRVRIERSMLNFPDDDARFRIVQIFDPIGGYEYVTDIVNKVVHRIKRPPAAPRAAGDAAAPPSVEELARMSFHNDTLNAGFPAAGPPEISTDNLGPRWIEGILAHGIKTTRKYTAGSAGGRPLTITTEAWVSDELKVVVLSKRYEPAHGESVTRMFDHKSGEPDPALFLPPHDYRIIDEEDQFRIDVAIPAHG